MKTCTKCKASKALAEFNKSPKNRDGLDHSCKAAYYEANKEKIKAKQAAYWTENPSKRPKKSNSGQRIQWNTEMALKWISENRSDFIVPDGWEYERSITPISGTCGVCGFASAQSLNQMKEGGSSGCGSCFKKFPSVETHRFRST